MKITEVERELFYSQSSLTTKKNKTVAVQKRLARKSSKVKECVSLGGKRLDLDPPDAETDLRTKVILGNQKVENRGVSDPVNSRIIRLKNKNKQDERDNFVYYREHCKGKQTGENRRLQKKAHEKTGLEHHS